MFDGTATPLNELIVSLSFHQWLASVTERINQTMHYQFDGESTTDDWGNHLTHTSRTKPPAMFCVCVNRCYINRLAKAVVTRL